MIIRLDEPDSDGMSALHWFLYYHPVALAAMLRRRRLQLLNQREAAAFYRKHGPVVKVEPNTPENRRKP